MPFPVDVVLEAREEMFAIAAGRQRPLPYLDRLEAAVAALGDREPGHPILHEQPDDPSLPLFRGLFVPPGRAEVRVIFHSGGTRVRVVHARWAMNRPLSARDLRRFARR